MDRATMDRVESMDRGSKALKGHLQYLEVLEMHQTRRGWLQECLGCEARTEFNYYSNGNHIAHSLAEADFCWRCTFPCNYPYQTEIKELNTGDDLISVDRPFRCPVGPCKCCCFQEMVVTSNQRELGTIKETCYYLIPEFRVSDDAGTEIYRIHPPTCCGGFCINCCTEGNPCFGSGCCKVPCHVFPASMKHTNGSDNNIGKIVKKPKEAITELFTDAVNMDVVFPEDATPAEKGLLTGAALLLNSNFFEGADDR